jgi:hypothetical protein
MEFWLEALTELLSHALASKALPQGWLWFGNWKTEMILKSPHEAQSRFPGGNGWSQTPHWLLHTLLMEENDIIVVWILQKKKKIVSFAFYRLGWNYAQFSGDLQREPLLKAFSKRRHTFSWNYTLRRPGGQPGLAYSVWAFFLRGLDWRLQPVLSSVTVGCLFWFWSSETGSLFM